MTPSSKMMKKFINHKVLLLLTSLLFACDGSESTTTEEKLDDQESASSIDGLHWNHFDKQIFDLAKDQSKLVLLDVGANWCHWCHVMDDSTYANSQVIHYLNKHFIIAKEDQDSRPDLYAAYKKYGWPATIIFNADGEELMQLTGYQNPSRFLRSLTKVVANPVPQKAAEEQISVGSADLDEDELICNLFNSLDFGNGGHNWKQKTLIEGSAELALAKAKSDDKLKKWLELTINNSYNLVDPIWGGAYQYSTKGAWTNQHFEKLLKMQARYIKIYALYGNKYQDQKAIDKAIEIAEYCFNFLDGNGPLFGNSQNADLIAGVNSTDYYEKDSLARIKLGIPSIDKSQYSKENALFAEALIHLWAVTGNLKYKNRALQISAFLIKERVLKNGLIARSNKDEVIYSLADQQAFIEMEILMFQMTQDTIHLTAAQKNIDASVEQFYDQDSGFKSAAGELIVQPTIEVIVNAQLALNLNKFGHMKGHEKYKDLSRQVFRVINTRSNQKNGGYVPYLLTLNDQLNREPYHAELLVDEIQKDLSLNQLEMLKPVLLAPDQYVIFELTDLNNLIGEKLLFEGFSDGTMLFCTSKFCGSPMESPEEVNEFANMLINIQSEYACTQ